VKAVTKISVFKLAVVGCGILLVSYQLLFLVSLYNVSAVPLVVLGCTCSWLTDYFHKVVFLIADNPLSFILQHNGMQKLQDDLTIRLSFS